MNALKSESGSWNLEAWVAVRPDYNKTNEKAIQFFSFSYIFWDDIGSFIFVLTALIGRNARVYRFQKFILGF
jgi:hypothetical protein